MTKRTYANDQIEVHWDSDRCIHVGLCIQALPNVFDTSRRPWIVIDNAEPDAVADAVRRCPTGALRYHRLDGASEEELPHATTIRARRHGPLILTGHLRVENTHGEVVVEETRLALCRCGESDNQPFCDNSHRAAGFRDKPHRIDEARQDAGSPAEVCPPQDSDSAPHKDL